jgi:hypothetical protein
VFSQLFDADPRPESPIDFAIEYFDATPRAAVEARIVEVQKQLEDAD